MKPAGNSPRSVTVLGATGSIGDSTMDLLRQARDRYQVEALTAHSNVEALARLAREFTHWLAPAHGGALRFEPDADRIDALAAEREALWKRVSDAPFLTDDEKREAVGYRPRGRIEVNRP